MEERKEGRPPPLMALNHVSRLCRNVKNSIDFYTKVLGFVLVERPPALDFEGAWLFNYGIGIHLVQSKMKTNCLLTPTNWIPWITIFLSWFSMVSIIIVFFFSVLQTMHGTVQCEDMEEMEKRLKEFNTKYMKRTMEDGSGTKIDQLFFNDPDGFMVEICNCENLKLVPADSMGKIKLPFDHHNPPLDLDNVQDNDANSK
ncbi:hypothetical protein PTKIN_Ptkin12aG0213600 [Pterospermum kingtungense]